MQSILSILFFSESRLFPRNQQFHFCILISIFTFYNLLIVGETWTWDLFGCINLEISMSFSEDIIWIGISAIQYRNTEEAAFTVTQ